MFVVWNGVVDNRSILYIKNVMDKIHKLKTEQRKLQEEYKGSNAQPCLMHMSPNKEMLKNFTTFPLQSAKSK